MTNIWDTLNQPVTISGLELQNRFVLAPMTREQSPGGIPTKKVTEYYQRRAGSLGMIITEGTYIDHPTAGVSDRVPRLDSTGAEAGWRDVIAAVHAQGAVIFPQLWHLGCVRRAGALPFPDAPVFTPSGLSLGGKVIAEEPSLEEIDRVIDAFARSAVTAKSWGFDGVEIHGAHGYLLDQFFWKVTNRRSDKYGGSLEARTQMSIDVVQEIRHRVGPDFPIQFRFSQWKAGRWDERIAENPAELERILLPLSDAGVDIFHPSTRRFWQPAFAQSDLTLAGWTKRITEKPTILVGHVGVNTAFRSDTPSDSVPVDVLERLFGRQEFDLLAIGRALLADPQWVEKMLGGREDVITPYTKDSENIYY